MRAPVAGVIQTRTAQTGQYVQAGTVLASLLRREPLLLRFQVPEQDATPLRPGIPARFRVRDAEVPFRATVTHVADAADSTSRMVEVTARIDDPLRGELRPGAFAEVTVPVGDSVRAPVIPQTAIRPSERGFLAFVVEGSRRASGSSPSVCAPPTARSRCAAASPPATGWWCAAPRP